MAHDNRLSEIADCVVAWISYLTRLTSVLAIIVSSIGSAPAQGIYILNCANNYFPVYCRGQLPVLNSPPLPAGTMFFDFLLNSTAAGYYGDTLANASCAFQDRPLNPGEADTLEWNIFLTVNNQTVVDPIYAPFLACNASTDCVSNFCVQNNNGALVVQQATGQMFQEFAGSMSGSPALQQKPRRVDRRM